MKRGHYCTSCRELLGTFYKEYIIDGKKTEKGPFYLCENEKCREHILHPVDTTIERPLNTPFTWSKRVVVDNPLDLV